MTPSHNQQIVDFFRLTVGILTAFQFGLLAMTMYHYSRMIRRGHQGVTASHVLMMGLSYLILNIYVSCDLAGRLGKELSWRVILAAVALAVGLPSMMMILNHVNHRDNFEVKEPS